MQRPACEVRWPVCIDRSVGCGVQWNLSPNHIDLYIYILYQCYIYVYIYIYLYIYLYKSIYYISVSLFTCARLIIKVIHDPLSTPAAMASPPQARRRWRFCSLVLWGGGASPGGGSAFVCRPNKGGKKGQRHEARKGRG